MKTILQKCEHFIIYKNKRWDWKLFFNFNYTLVSQRIRKHVYIAVWIRKNRKKVKVKYRCIGFWDNDSNWQTLNNFTENRKKNRSQRSAKNVSNCSHHLIEQCPLPQWCNSFCPTFRNQYNGQEIDFFKVFAASGMDSKSMAELLGVNTSTVNAMNANTISTLLLDTFRQKRPQ